MSSPTFTLDASPNLDRQGVARVVKEVIDRAALMVMLAQVAITDTIYGGDNDTIH